MRNEDLELKYADVKTNEKKLGDILENIIKQLEAIKKEKEEAMEELRSLKSTMTP